MDLEVIIGFETHVELSTRTKLFCRCKTSYGAKPNGHVCPVCTGQPGALPVLNRKAIELSVRAGLAFDCRINGAARFARKNYFYPDLPKGYQISQYEEPLCEDGFLEITGDDGTPYAVGIKRIHLEEDAGKLVHSSKDFGASDYSLVDYNRSGVPLLEIVTDHTRNPIRSTAEARDYLERVRQILRYIDVSECIMEQGQLRCDVNISMRPKGSELYGNRVEIKNMSSFRFMVEALDYEINRQSETLRTGGELVQETRLFDEAKKLTLPMRSKEDAPDYRYFPDPDLLSLQIPESFVEEIRSTMPELPGQKVHRLVTQYGIPRRDALLLSRDRKMSEYFETCTAHSRDIRRLTTWLTKDLFRLLGEGGQTIETCPVKPAHFANLVNLIAEGEITDKIGRTVLDEMFRSGQSPESIIAARNLKPILDTETLNRVIGRVMEENGEVVAQIRQGHQEPINFLIGQVMKATQGKAHPGKVRDLLMEKLAGPS
jgi:aspartyl-tRNA(Asn)/glutamyl-tRNA(Gln) amidotransferase subunit B